MVKVYNFLSSKILSYINHWRTWNQSHDGVTIVGRKSECNFDASCSCFKFQNSSLRCISLSWQIPHFIHFFHPSCSRHPLNFFFNEFGKEEGNMFSKPSPSFTLLPFAKANHEFHTRYIWNWHWCTIEGLGLVKINNTKYEIRGDALFLVSCCFFLSSSFSVGFFPFPSIEICCSIHPDLANSPWIVISRVNEEDRHEWDGLE